MENCKLRSSPVFATILFYIIAIRLSIISADEFQWRPIAWEGISVNSVVSPRDSSDLLYVTITNHIPEDQFGVHKSYDGGISWEFLLENPNPGSTKLTVDPKSQSTIYCGSLSSGFVDPDIFSMRSLNAGATWDKIDAPIHHIVASPHSDSLLIATGRPMLYWDLWRSADAGTTWTYLCGEESEYPTDNVIFNPCDSLEVFSWYHFINGLHGLARSRDGGLTWDIVLEGLIEGFDQDPFNCNHWIAMKYDVSAHTGYFCESFNNGDSWDIRELPYGIEIIRQMAFDRVDPRIIYMIDVFSDYENIGIYRSMDGGVTWAPMNEGFDNVGGTWEIHQTEGRPGRLIVARGDGLWEWTDQVPGEIANPRLPGSLSIESASPCPFQNTLTGRLLIPKYGTVKADIYAVNGTHVRSLFNQSFPAGYHQFIWDGRNNSEREAATGVYLLRVTQETDSASHLLVKLR